MPRDFPSVCGGQPGRSAHPRDVTRPFDNTVVGRTWLAGDEEFEQTADSAVAAAPAMRELLAYLGEILARAGLPAAAISVLPMHRRTGDCLVTDPGFRLLTFTGSSAELLVVNPTS